VTERELERPAQRRLAVLRHVEEVSGKRVRHLPLLRDQPALLKRPRRNGKPQTRLLDLLPGRTGKAYAEWLQADDVGPVDRLAIDDALR